MVITMAGQMKQLVIMMICGFLLALTYDIIRLFRRIVAHTEFYIAIEDIVFLFFGAVAAFVLVLWLNYGQIRAFMIMGIFIGAFVYCAAVSRFFLKISVYVSRLLLKVIYNAALVLTYPFRVTLQTIAAIFEYFVNFLKKVLKKTWDCGKIYMSGLIKKFAISGNRGNDGEQTKENKKI